MSNLNFGVNLLRKSSANVSLGDSTNPWTIVSPSLTGTPTAPTATKGTNTTQIATTAFVKTALEDAVAPTAITNNEIDALFTS